jgi:hypothetical protein
MRCCKYNVPESSGWHPRKVQIEIHLFQYLGPNWINRAGGVSNVSLGLSSQISIRP